jgi:predicted ester cyclase
LENKEIVRQFLEQVRSGKFPEKAVLFMADSILAHQMNSENQTTVIRTPRNYSEHIEEFVTLFGNFTFEISELIADEDKVYTRWKQIGNHLAEIDGYKPTGKPLIEVASCVYRLENGKIVEYWIQIDRLGFENQLKTNRLI